MFSIKITLLITSEISLHHFRWFRKDFENLFNNFTFRLIYALSSLEFLKCPDDNNNIACVDHSFIYLSHTDTQGTGCMIDKMYMTLRNEIFELWIIISYVFMPVCLLSISLWYDIITRYCVTHAIGDSIMLNRYWCI